jgi:hypothetical protein
MRTRLLICCLLLAVACGGGDSRGGRTSINGVRVDGTSLAVTYLVGLPECYDSSKVEVVETTTEVRLTAWVKGKGGSCPAIGIPRTDIVTLDAPLGDRPMVDTSTGERVLVRPSP